MKKPITLRLAIESIAFMGRMEFVERLEMALLEADAKLTPGTYRVTIERIGPIRKGEAK